MFSSRTLVGFEQQVSNKLIIHTRNEAMRTARQTDKPRAPHFDRRKRQLQGFCKQLAVFIDRFDLGYIVRFRVSYFYLFQSPSHEIGSTINFRWPPP
ncbi:hypothetical protein S4A8_12669 [Salinisphaera sp. S4-8]